MAPCTLEAWLEPLVPSYGDDRLTLGCPTSFHRDRVRAGFLPDIERCAQLEAGRPVCVELEVEPAVAAAPAIVAEAAESGPSSAPTPTRRVSRPAHSARARDDEGGRAPVQRELAYRFDNFVVGTCNALAREASLAVAQGSQHSLNPLVLSAASGLGKTHLARAIALQARQQGERRVIYTSAEGFTNEFTGSLRSRRVEGFKRRYRQGCRLLVLEDVQFLDARKKATQLELFHTVSHLLDVGARVVLTADRLPRDIEGLDPRLRSKLTSGLVAELEPPTARVRREILRQKAADGGVGLPESCLELLVGTVLGSVRDLEGVLIQLVATAALLKRPIDLELTRMALRKLSPMDGAPRSLEVHEVVETVAAYFKKRPDELALRSRRRDVLAPRQLAMYLCRRYTDAALSEIGSALGRDHSAVANAVRVVERRILERAPVRYQVEALCVRLDERARGGA